MSDKERQRLITSKQRKKQQIQDTRKYDEQ